MNNLIVLGAQWGDEGKGKLVDLLSDRFDVVIRYQGGHNAGHTIIVDERKFVLKLIPSGILHPGKSVVIGNGLVVDPIALVTEIDALEAAGVDVAGQLHISNRAHVLLPFHRLMERLSEARPGRVSIGTTSRGIGPCYEDKAGRRGIRFGDFVRFDCFDQAYDALLAEKIQILKAFDLFDNEDDRREHKSDERDRYRQIAERLRPLVCDTAGLLNQEIRNGRRLLFEGAQGTMLDMDHGTYPFVTSSSSTAGGACTGTGVPPNKISGVIGICKAYITRVGGGPFPTELKDDVGEQIRKRGKEFGAVTGRPRRCGWFDVPLLRYSAMINGFDSLVITKLDVLDELEEIPVCLEYQVNGESVEDMPPSSDDLGKVQPVYECLPGWRSSTFGISEYGKLPEQARDYLEYLEKVTGVEVGCISTGPERNQTIIRKGSRFEQLLG
jgi:adenylosuccinate synthase